MNTLILQLKRCNYKPEVECLEGPPSAEIPSPNFKSEITA